MILINNSHLHLNFGLTGTVVGIHKEKIEIVLDEHVIGGTDLEGRCDKFRGGVC